MKEQLTPLQIAVYAVNCPHDGEDTYANEVAGKIQELIDQEKAALKEENDALRFILIAVDGYLSGERPSTADIIQREVRKILATGTQKL